MGVFGAGTRRPSAAVRSAEGYGGRVVAGAQLWGFQCEQVPPIRPHGGRHAIPHTESRRESGTAREHRAGEENNTVGIGKAMCGDANVGCRSVMSNFIVS